MIEKLKVFDKNIDPYDYKEPLLKYAEKVANHFWKVYDPTTYILDNGMVVPPQFLPSTVPYWFAVRYISGDIDTTSREDYENAIEIQETINAFKLDTSKFWYLCLVVKDYVEGQTINAIKYTPTIREDIDKLVAGLKAMQPTFATNKFMVKNEGELKFKLQGKRSRTITITDSTSLALISASLMVLKSKLDNKYTNTLDRTSVDLNDTVNLPLTYQIFLFHKYMSWFLRDYHIRNNSMVSKDKNLLISRMVYILKMNKSKAFYKEYLDDGRKSRYLQDYIKDYKGEEYTTINKYYL